MRSVALARRGEDPARVGVEIGQLLFVAMILLLAGAFRQLELRWPPIAAQAPAYLVGCLGAYWTIDRIVMMGAGL